MKQISSLFIAMFALITSSFANGPEVSKPVLDAFQNSYAQAREVAWTETSSFYKATFMLQGKTVSAYYSTEGELMAVTRNLAIEEMPKGLQSALKNERAERWVTAAFMVSTLGNTTYYVVLEDADSRVILQSKGSKKWTVYQTQEKQ